MWKTCCRSEFAQAQETNEWNDIHNFFVTTFDSFLELNAAFKVCSTRRRGDTLFVYNSIGHSHAQCHSPILARKSKLD